MPRLGKGFIVSQNQPVDVVKMRWKSVVGSILEMRDGPAQLQLVMIEAIITPLKTSKLPAKDELGN